MIQWPEDIKVYLHREPVDFRKAINGLSVIVQDDMALSPFDAALFVFCNKNFLDRFGCHPLDLLLLSGSLDANEL